MNRRKLLSAIGTSTISMSALKYSSLISESSINDSNTKIIGHRGCSAYKKDNSLEGIKCAINSSAHGVEIDIHKTADDKFILNHDPHILTRNKFLLIRNNTLEDIKKHKDRVSLKEALDILSNETDFTVYLDLKSTNIASEIVEIVKEYSMLESVVIIAWLESEFSSINNIDVNTGLISYYPSINLINRAKKNNIDSIIPHYTSRKLNHVIDYAHRNNISCGYWAISDSKTDIEKGLSVNPDFIITNKPRYAYQKIN